MPGFDKNKLGDILKKALDPKAEEVKKTIATPTPVNKSNPISGKASAATGISTGKKVEAASDSFTSAKVAAGVRGAQSKLDDLKASKEKQAFVLKTKTHQDLINAAYKAAEKLGIAPWVLLRAAEWGHFTDDRGKKYTGPAIDDIEGLDDAQKKALKEVLGL